MRVSKTISLFLGVLTIITATPAQSAPKNYYAPPSQVDASWKSEKGGKTIFANATAALAYNESTQDINKIRIAIDAKRMRAETTEQATLGQALSPYDYPEITLTTTATLTLKDNKGSVKGALSLHGETKEASFTITKTSAETAVSLDLKIQVQFAPKDYGLITEDPSETLTLTIDLQAIKP